MEDSQEFLPAGWITETKTRKSGSKTGAHYKISWACLLENEDNQNLLQDITIHMCYVDPSTGSKFYSKEQVVRYLKRRKLNSETSEKKSKNTPCPNNVASQIENSPDCLPPGWIKEIRFRQREGGGFRKDPYYTDPATGRVFRSKKSVLNYLKTGVLDRHAMKPKKRCIGDMRPTDNKVSPPVATKLQKVNATRRCLLNSYGVNSSGAMKGKVKESALNEQGEVSGSEMNSSGSPQCSKRRQSKQVQARRLLEKHSVKLEDKDQPLESLNSQVALGPEGQQQPPDPLKSQLPLESEGHKQLSEIQVPSKLKENKLLENMLSTETQEKLPGKGKPLEFGDMLSEKVGPSGTERKCCLKNGLSFECIDDRLLGVTPQIESQDNISKSRVVLDKNLSVNGTILMESEGRDLHSGPPVEAQDAKSSDGSSMKPEDKKELDTRSQMEDKDVEQLDGRLADVNTVPSELEETKLPQNKMGSCQTKSTRVRSRKAKAEKVPIIPRRTSKRLAGLEADQAANFDNPDQACRLAAKQQVRPLPPVSEAREDQSGEAKDEKPVDLDQKHQPTNDNDKLPQPTNDADQPLQSLVLPFGDSWPDPCLEFAFKTLIGDIPEAMDTSGIEDYFQQQIRGQSHSTGHDGLFQPKLFGPGTTGSLPCFLDNELQANGRKQRERGSKGGR